MLYPKEFEEKFCCGWDVVVGVYMLASMFVYCGGDELHYVLAGNFYVVVNVGCVV